MAFDPQTSAAGPPTSPGVQFSLEIRILHLGAFRWTKPNGGQNGGQAHSYKRRAAATNRRASDHLGSLKEIKRCASSLYSRHI